MVRGTCHCAQVTIALESAPAEVTSCNCSICRRLGTLWAYYSAAEVEITGSTATYRWGDRLIDFHRCTVCGIATHWTSADGSPGRMGINLRLFDPAVLGAARIRYLDGADTWQARDTPWGAQPP